MNNIKQFKYDVQRILKQFNCVINFSFAFSIHCLSHHHEHSAH